ncbi:glycosyltransferase family 2 protein [Roseibium denhamense]|uniref:Glycosyltransferase involved in cell wall bisynthesis n=1 Tax=Roseibium denhamense TaxID=76305 RepID=A0ABY1NT88_9HYPH|nr:glycosyltransferase family 2 protein [Roseibium denhamense]MTI05384.1 glycosyltransferase family 2 protein [Roseibium denhamense]SMP17610.1 Glycosyltransferase involved in cell wall bisynthesis [Roseibium denhamense]
MTDLDQLAEVAVVIPCYRCAVFVGDVVRGVPASVGSIICVNDASDDETGRVLDQLAQTDPRIRVLTHERNQGVGAATVTGYRSAIELGARVIIKIDSDGQMNPAFIPALVAPILSGEADYVKGNRFFDIDRVLKMPAIRLIGNAGLSFLTKLSSGYWGVSDPTNGYTAIAAEVADLLPANKLHKRYFFESDMLFRLNCLGAVVVEQPMETRYGNEVSHLSVTNALLTFPLLHARNFFKRVVYNYFVRDFDAASLSLLIGLALAAFGVTFGASAWMQSHATDVPATAGTVMLSATPLLIGIQLLLSFLQHDVARTPRIAIHPKIMRRRVLVSEDLTPAEATNAVKN